MRTRVGTQDVTSKLTTTPYKIIIKIVVLCNQVKIANRLIIDPSQLSDRILLYTLIYK